MQRHRKCDRQQKSPKAYSPDYNSPYQSQSQLASRFDNISPQQRCVHYCTKENISLPVFQDRNAQMIPQVTFDNSNSYCGCGCAHILSDLSDEQLIRQLQLNINEKLSLHSSSTSGSQLNKYSNQNLHAILAECQSTKNNNEKVQSRTLADRTNKASSPLVNGRFSQVKVTVAPEVRLPSPQSHQNRFIQGQRHTHTWQDSSPSGSLPRKTRHSVEKILSNNRSFHQQSIEHAAKKIRPNAVNQSNAIESIIQYAPEPHPYPSQLQMTRYNLVSEPSMAPTETMPTDQKQTSPAISTDSQYVAFINTASGQKNPPAMGADSGSTLQTKKKERAQQNEHDAIKVRQFCQSAIQKQVNSTIEEQPTQEQLQNSSTAAIVLYQSNTKRPQTSAVSHTEQMSYGQPQACTSMKKPNAAVQEPMMLSSGIFGRSIVEFQKDFDCNGESESMAQIRMINEAMRVKFPSNYSPNRSQDLSGSLQDFSLEGGRETDQNFPRRHEMALSNDNYYVEGISANDLKKRLISMSQANQVTRQQSFDYKRGLNSFERRQANIEHEVQKSNPVCESTQQEKQPSRQSSFKSIGNKTFQVNEAIQRPRTGRVPARGRSPIDHRGSFYPQCQIPSEDLYKPILRGGQGSTKPKQEFTSQSMSGLPPNLDFIPTSMTSASSKLQPYSKTNVATPQTPTYLSSPTEQAPGTRSRIETRASVRKNQESQTLTAKTSQSPVSNRTSPQNGTNFKRCTQTSNISTMLHRYAFTKRAQSRELHQILTERRRLQDARSKQSPSPIPNVRSRNDVLSISHNRASSKQGEIATLQTSSQTSLVMSSAEQNTMNRYKNKKTSNRTSTSNTQNQVKLSFQNSNPKMSSASTVPQSSLATNVPTNNSRRSSYILDQQCENHPSQPHNRNHQLPVPTRASLYQMRRALDAMRNLDITMFLELERIKKPTAAVLAIARMSCIFFEALRHGDPLKMDQVETMQSWQQIQTYVREQLVCNVPEFRNILKYQIVSLSIQPSDSDCFELSDDLAEIVGYMEKIHETFFAEAKIRVIRRYTQQNRQMKLLVQLIYSIVCLSLDLEREFSAENLLGYREQPVAKFEDVKQLLMQHYDLLNTINETTEQPTKSNEINKTPPLDIQLDAPEDEFQMNNNQIINSNINNTSDQTICQGCQCHFRQHSQQSLNQQKSAQSICQKSNEHPEQKKRFTEQIKFPQQHQQSQSQLLGTPEAKLDFQVFKTVDQQSFSSKNSRSMRLLKEQNDALMTEDKESGGDTLSPDKQLNIKNYTTVQIPKPNHSKPRTSVTPDDLMNVMSITEVQKPSKKQQQLNHEEAQNNQPKSSRRQYSAANLQKLAQPKQQYHKVIQASKERVKKRKASANSGSEFISVVRANGQPTNAEQLTSRHTSSKITPRAKGSSVRMSISSSITPKHTASSRAATKRVTTSKPQPQFGTTLGNAAKSKRERKDVSPSDVTPRSTSRQLKKNPSNLKSASQKRLPSSSALGHHQQQPLTQTKPFVTKHSRNTTLYKNTASTTAKQKQQHTRSSKQSLPRDSSNFNLRQQHLMPSPTLKNFNASSQAQVKLFAKKPKNQTSSKAVGNRKRSTTPSSRLNTGDTIRVKQPAKHQKRPTNQRNHVQLKSNSSQGLTDFIAIEQTIQMEQNNQVDFDNNLNEVMETVPSFGGDLAGWPTEDHRFNSKFIQEVVEGDTTEAMGSKTTISAPLIAPSFTPERQNSSIVQDLSLIDPQTPCLQGNNLYDWTTSQQDTAQLGKYYRPESQEVFECLEDLTCKPRTSFDGGRQEFIIAKAQAITENINQCYKSHNMPQIDMATIQKLKMRRLQLMHQVCTNNETMEATPKEQQQPNTYRPGSKGTLDQKMGNRQQKQKSCNVDSAMTMKSMTPEDEKELTQEDNSFAEALFKLRAEVESLMQRRAVH